MTRAGGGRQRDVITLVTVLVGVVMGVCGGGGLSGDEVGGEELRGWAVGGRGAALLTGAGTTGGARGVNLVLVREFDLLDH